MPEADGRGERRVLSGGTDDTTEDGDFACFGGYRHRIIDSGFVGTDNRAIASREASLRWVRSSRSSAAFISSNCVPSPPEKSKLLISGEDRKTLQPKNPVVRPPRRGVRIREMSVSGSGAGHPACQFGLPAGVWHAGKMPCGGRLEARPTTTDAVAPHAQQACNGGAPY